MCHLVRPAGLHNRGLLMVVSRSLSDDSRLSSSDVPSVNMQRMNTWSCRGAASIGQSRLRFRDYFTSPLWMPFGKVLAVVEEVRLAHHRTYRSQVRGTFDTGCKPPRL